MIKHIAKNIAAGNDLYIGSLILICIDIDPDKSKAKPIAATFSILGYHIEAINNIESVTLKKPMV